MAKTNFITSKYEISAAPYFILFTYRTRKDGGIIHLPYLKVLQIVETFCTKDYYHLYIASITDKQISI